MKQIIPFAFEGKQIRVVRDENGEAMFVGKDIAEALGYADPTSAMKQHCRGVAKHHPIVDSLIVVAQPCPEFTAKIVDCYQVTSMAEVSSSCGARCG